MATVKIKISDQLREDLLITAIEGGSNYWYWLGNDAMNIIREHMDMEKGKYITPISIAIWTAIKNSKIIPIHDAENPEEELGTINLTKIDMGEQIMAEKYPHHFKNIINEKATEWDAETADVWFQCAVLGEIVYG